MRFPVICQPPWLRIVLSFVATLFFCTALAAKEVAIGVFAYQGEDAAISDWSPVLSYLNDKLPDYRFRMIHYEADDLRNAIAQHHVDLVITNPGYYVQMEAEFGISRIATVVSPVVSNPGRAIGSVVFTRADRTDIQTLPNLADKKIAAVSLGAFGGYLIAARELLHQGIILDTEASDLHFVGLPMGKVVDAVQFGVVDAGIVRTCLLEKMATQGAIALKDFRILGARVEEGFPCASSTPLYPDWPIAVTRRTEPGLAKAVAHALLEMPEVEGGVSWAVPADYQPVHELYRELRVGPYAYLNDVSFEGMARRFWPWLLGLMMILAAWIIHTVRAEQLVHRRTVELRESLRARQLAESRIRESQEKMEHLSRLSVLGELSGNLAHELNQPLTTIGTYARSVLRRQAGGTLTAEAVSEACTEIANEAERAGGIVQRIRHFAKKRVATREPVDLSLIAAEAKRLIVGMLAHAPDIDIENRAIRMCRAMADGPQIQQVLLNLVKNAIDAGRDLPVERQGIRIGIENANKRLLVHVMDKGNGLDAEQREHLFEPFFTTKPEGLGLGLSICKTIIEAHGGRLWAEPNADGLGMCFSFSLPCHEYST